MKRKWCGMVVAAPWNNEGCARKTSRRRTTRVSQGCEAPRSKEKSTCFASAFCGGDEGIRTPDLCVANASLYQLSHAPTAIALYHPVTNYASVFHRLARAKGHLAHIHPGIRDDKADAGMCERSFVNALKAGISRGRLFVRAGGFPPRRISRESAPRTLSR